MDKTKELVTAIIESLQEKKGKKIVSIDLSDIPDTICKYIVICEGNTPTQVSALTDSVKVNVKKKVNDRPITTAGEQESQWVGIDYGTVIVHIFLPDLRSYYNLETLWTDATITNIQDID